jgi:competence protein ComEA
VSELDRPRLALYVVLGAIVCFLGARYLRTQVAPAGDGAAAVTAPATPTAAPAAPTPAAGTTSVRLERADGARVAVHVAGAVRQPGVYRLPAGSRVDDALRRAGGPARGADLTAVNLAAKLEDGRQVLVPLRPQAAGGGAGGAAGGGGVGGAGAAAGGGGAAAGGGAAGGGAGATAPGAIAGAPTAPVNLNTATLEQLDTLDGVGPGIAQRILDYRQQHGGFRRVEELGEVPGIGDKRLATLRALVTV